MSRARGRRETVTGALFFQNPALCIGETTLAMEKAAFSIPIWRPYRFDVFSSLVAHLLSGLCRLRVSVVPALVTPDVCCAGAHGGTWTGNGWRTFVAE